LWLFKASARVKAPAICLFDQASLNVHFSEVNAITFKAVDAVALRIISLRSGSTIVHDTPFIKRRGVHKRVPC